MRGSRVALAPLLLIPAMAAGQLPSEVSSLAPMIERVSPAVVNISVSGVVRLDSPLAEDPLFRRFFPESSRPVQSAGSGVIVDADDGYILTNHHVVADADNITVTLFDNRSYDAHVVGSDQGSDIAVLKVPAQDLTQIDLGDSDAVRVGDFVVAIGNPFGLSHTVTSGIVSGLGRSNINETEGAYEDFIQTDASINPGNSGGALVDLDGGLIGINSAILSRSGGNIGIGFAIPVNMARSIMDQLVAYGEVRRGLLGVSIRDVTPDIAATYQLGQSTGALIMTVAPESAADAAGLKVEDVIVSVNDQRVRDSGSLRNAIGLIRPGERVRVGFVREGRQQSVEATLGSAGEVARAAVEPERVSNPLFSGVVTATSKESDGRLAIALVPPDSEAYARGLRNGDVILAVNAQRVRSIAEAEEIAAAARSVLVKVQRGGREQLLQLR